ncbi:hypothetical protein, partial [Plesiomonas sp.]|uniref:hypothetical protein n=1 Tax=Plesiomonas sp. TaxID=2486279 RepID=UPI003F412B03
MVHYADAPSAFFYIAASQLQPERPPKPNWMNPPANKPARRGVTRNSWLRRTLNSTENSWRLPLGSEVILSGEQAPGTVIGGLGSFY